MSHNNSTTISTEVSLDIFNDPLIHQTTDVLIARMKPTIIAKISEITRGISKNSTHFDIDEETVFKYFQNIFFEDVLAKAVTICSKGMYAYNMVICVNSLITEENLINAANENLLYDAYRKAII